MASPVDLGRAARFALLCALTGVVTLCLWPYGRLVLGLGFLPFPRARRVAGSRLAALWSRLLLGAARRLGLISIEVRGQVPDARPLLVVANHQSLFDIPVLLGVLAPRQLVRFVVKQELRWGVPAISPATRLMGSAFVKRTPSASRRNVAALRRFARELAEDGAAGVVFPEGTWEPGGKPLPFRTLGLKTLIEERPFAVLPVTVDGTWRSQRLRDLVRLEGPLEVVVTIGQLVRPETPDAARLVRELEAAVHAALRS